MRTEYGALKRGILRLPADTPMGQPINLVQAFYFSTAPPDLATVHRQYQFLTDLLTSSSIQLDYLPPTDSPFQIFTRDIGFAIGEQFFIASMMVDVRRREVDSLKTWLGSQGIPFTLCPATAPIEGGDILVDYPLVYVGIGARTSEESADWLASELAPPWRVVRVHTNPKVLHLDCVLNILSPDTIAYCPSLIDEGRESVEERYPQRIILSEQEVFDMACNVLSLDESRLAVEASQLEIQRKLESLGFRVDAVDWSEIRKFGGLFRCAICPLERSS